MRQLEELEVLMLSLHRGTKLCAAIVVAAIMLIGALSWSYAETGSVRLNIVKAGFIVGIGGGSGTPTSLARIHRVLQRLQSWVAEESQNCRMRTAWF